MKRRYMRRGSDAPSRMWIPVPASAGGTVATLTPTTWLELQAPTAGAVLTADPPEDVTILRIVGEFTMTASAAGSMTVGLIRVQTGGGAPAVPDPTGPADHDQRWLWLRYYEAGGATSWANSDATRDPWHWTLDIAPKLRMEQGQRLSLIMDASAGTWTMSSKTIRMLVQRSRRR